jgi:hypothetical protein
MDKKTYQVWHDVGWPQSRLNQLLGGWPPSRFPEDYVHVANVRANGLREAVDLTTDRGSLLDELAANGQFQPWSDNKQVQSLVISTRDTDQGDVVVDPHGQAYRVKQVGFEALGPPSPEAYRPYERTPEDREKQWAAVAKIMEAADRARANEEAAGNGPAAEGRQENTKDSFRKLLADNSPTRKAPEKERDRGMER